jgi:MinD superfamily P-loop ATPase
MIISVSSGKGGTGKTTIAASIAVSISNSVYIDCDVEEPNGHILFKPEFDTEIPTEILLPIIDFRKCSFCNKCIEVCEYNALINLGTEIILFDELCHGCGACMDNY